MKGTTLSKSEVELAVEIFASKGPESVVRTSLSTNERVIARVTDGIYRQPGSALRELVSNAYDADATRVTIKTDAPRFEKIVVEDNGIGMTPDALAHMLKNIGGSAKRTEIGYELGITAEEDLDVSPSGRPLIGKLGIGLFSVSQLTRSFQVITKVSGDSYRTIALVKLNQFSEGVSGDEEQTYEAGDVAIWREETTDVEEQGTTIVLTSVRPQTQESLRSRDIWDAVDSPLDAEAGERSKSFIPMYHIGRTDENGDYVEGATSEPRRLPWPDSDDPAEAFHKFVTCVWDVATRSDPNPKLEGLFDNYLRMVWELALALPLAYVEGSLLDEDPRGEWTSFYELSNGGRGATARRIEVPETATSVRSLLGFVSGTENPLPFAVFVDDLRLSRPIRFRGLPSSANQLKTPLVFLGRLSESFEGYPTSASAGPLEFEAYFYWSPKIAPVDHRGVLVRIHDSSGAPFDHSFFRYQVSEQTRMRQITCEIFVSKGVEPALNIDREAYNTAHPHMVVLTKWVHGALRQIATAQKREAEVVRRVGRVEEQANELWRLSEIVTRANQVATEGAAEVPEVVFLDGNEIFQPEEPIAPRYAFPLIDLRGEADLFADPSLSKSELSQLRAITQLLSVYGALDSLTPGQQADLLKSIGEVLRSHRA
jgi:hypothetical protein